MYPELYTFPGGFTIKTYGFCLMVGFLSAVWLAMRRAGRVKVDPDLVLDVSFVALIAGVGGARLFYVVHYWESQYADAPNKFLAIIDIRQGGLEFLGGLLGASIAIVTYLWIKKQSIRLFLDILAPGAMWGLGIGRIGCFFNGCCFGGVCAAGHAAQPQYPWAVQFPYGSPAHIRQWEERQVTLPTELVNTSSADFAPWPVPENLLSMKPERRDGPGRAFEQAKKMYDEEKSKSSDPEKLEKLKSRMEAAKRADDEKDRELAPLRDAQKYPSRVSPDRPTTVTELQDLAAVHHSLAVHPVQLYAAFSALLLSGLLSAVFYRRKRHGVVIALLFVLYPVSRMLEEIIRVDNPHDVAGLTVSQSISIGMTLFGAVWLWALYRRLPERSPAADAAAAPPPEIQNGE